MSRVADSLKSLAWLLKAQGPSSRHAQRAVKSLIKRYETTGDVEQVEEWRLKLDKKLSTADGE